MSALLELHAVVAAAPDAVAEVLLDVRPGGRSPLATDGVLQELEPGEQFVVVRDGSRLTVTVDPAARSVIQQGEWWYRGVTGVEPDPGGSRVTFRIFNVADNNGWAVRFVSRGPLNAAPREFAAQIQRLGEVLGVGVRIL